MKTILTITAFILTGLTIAQDNDAKAKTILDELSKKTKAYISLQVEFTIKTTSKSGNETLKGKAIMKGFKYNVDLGEQELRSDEIKKWTLIHGKTKECYETLIGKGEKDDDDLNPAKLLTIWEKGFKYRFVKEENGIQEIHLFPIDTKKSKYHTVVLKVDKAKGQVNNIIIKKKNGDVNELLVSKFSTNVVVDESKFKFLKKDFPDYTVIRD